ncbi:uncharacterized protein TNCV_1007141 [Trichonephila clavipes]|nr:uncharacterized protein TNCV_1007141 [Trichonephila clavipes]
MLEYVYVGILFYPKKSSKSGSYSSTLRLKEGRKVRSGYLPFRTNASTLPITPKRLSSRDVEILGNEFCNRSNPRCRVINSSPGTTKVLPCRGEIGARLIFRGSKSLRSYCVDVWRVLAQVRPLYLIEAQIARSAANSLHAASWCVVNIKINSNYVPPSDKMFVAAVAEWYRYRTVACFVTGSSPVPLKTRRVGQRCTLNLSRAETSSRWCGEVVRRGGASSGVVHVT